MNPGGLSRRDPFFSSEQPAAIWEEVEILGPHLRLSGRVEMGRFRRLSDHVNHSPGYLLLHDARLLRRNGDPTNLTMSELNVNRNEITFIGQREVAHAQAERGDPDGFGGFDRPAVTKVVRRLVMFTPGHTITGDVSLYAETSLALFLDSPDPRFVPVTNVRVRSLADRRVISHFELLLVNKTQMTAAAEADRAEAVAD